MRKLKYYVACSLDGFIAREDGSFDYFLAEGEHIPDYLESLNSFDAVLMGRNTYEVGLKVGVTDPYPNMKSYVISRTIKESPNERVKIVSENVAEFVRELKEETGKDIYLCGGGDLSAVLFDENLIDEMILKVHPVLVGSGIRLFSELVRQMDLEFISSKTFKSGVVVLHYRVKN
ncbi:MAG TPA: dihydrofolate reductase family protein [Blastocatellia bacterium]|nr:dihydrofolate reductase family protein [Blastocatellia bacterium]